MGTSASKPSKGQKDSINENNSDEQQITIPDKQLNEEKKEENGQTVRFINDGIENGGSHKLQCIPAVVNNTTNRPKFYYYPNKQVSDSSKETIFITSSQFPYRKPKAVLVRPRQPENEIIPNRFKKISNGVPDRSRYSNFQNSADRTMYTKPPHRCNQSVNERHWSSNHVLPTNSFTPDRVLPHRTVAELRRSSLTCPGAEENFFYGNQFSRHSVEIAPGVNRPPTPSTMAWFPVRRTEDYLVASSLLAGEQDRDRRRSVGRDVHDF